MGVWTRGRGVSPLRHEDRNAPPGNWSTLDVLVPRLPALDWCGQVAKDASRYCGGAGCCCCCCLSLSLLRPNIFSNRLRCFVTSSGVVLESVELPGLNNLFASV